MLERANPTNEDTGVERIARPLVEVLMKLV